MNLQQTNRELERLDILYENLWQADNLLKGYPETYTLRKSIKSKMKVISKKIDRLMPYWEELTKMR